MLAWLRTWRRSIGNGHASTYLTPRCLDPASARIPGRRPRRPIPGQGKATHCPPARRASSDSRRQRSLPTSAALPRNPSYKVSAACPSGAALPTLPQHPAPADAPDVLPQAETDRISKMPPTCRLEDHLAVPAELRRDANEWREGELQALADSVTVVWCTCQRLPQFVSRWSVRGALSEASSERYRGACAMITSAWFEQRMSWFPVGRLQVVLVPARFSPALCFSSCLTAGPCLLPSCTSTS